MGLFSDSVKTYVSSSVYNLAGDIDLRPNFLRTVLIGSSISGSKSSVGSSLVQAMLGGSGMQQRRFFRWAKNNYDLGMPKASISGAAAVDATVVIAGLTPLLGMPAGSTLRIISSAVDTVDVDYWAKIWILNNHPDLPDEDWSADWDPVNSLITVDMIIAGAPASASIPAPADFVWGLSQETVSKKLLFVIYQVLSPDVASGLINAEAPLLFTYRMGTGNVIFDSMALSSVAKTEFFPAIPLRIDNKSVRHDDLEALYDAAKPAFKKLTGSGIDKLLDQIEEHENIDDIDFCFLAQGVSLNSKENEAKRYLYRFFANLMADQKTTKAGFEEYLVDRKRVKKETTQWARWTRNNERGLLGDAFREELSGAPKPTAVPAGMAAPTYSELRVYAENLPSFDHRVRWIYIDEVTGYGNGKTFDGDLSRGKMKVGDFWFHAEPDIVIEGLKGRSIRESPVIKATVTEAKYNRISMFYQRSKFAYSRLDIVGLEHKNLVYSGKAVTILAKDALKETDDESGFLVPLHYPSLQDMGLLRSTQLAYSSTYLVFNSYVKVRKKWWQKGIFRIIMVIAAAVLSVVFPPAGVGLSAGGILGANLAIGAAMGFTSAMGAAIAGAIVNALASMILSTLIQQGAIEIFGEKFGAIIGTLVTFAAMNYAKAYVTTGNFDVDWGAIFRVDSLMKLTNSVSGAYAMWLQVDTATLYEDVAGLADKYKSKFQEVEDASDEMLGTTPSLIDPMMLTDTLEYSGESSAEFYSRTTMTGDQIAELSQALIYDFAEISLELPKLQA